MMTLHADWRYLEQEFGCGLRDRFLMPVRSFDNAKAVAPFLLEDGFRRTALFVHVEKGNAEAAMLPPAIGRAFYRPYFSFVDSERPPAIYATLTDALNDLAQGRRALKLDAELPVAVGAELARSFDVCHEALVEPGPVTVREVAPGEVTAALAAWRPAAAGAARRLLERSPVRERLAPYLDPHPDDRFARLDTALQAENIDTLVLTTALNIQEVAGVPMRAKRRPLAALYRPGGHIRVVEAGTAAGGRSFPSARAALDAVAGGGRFACEMDDIGLGLFSALALDTRETVAADTLLRRWRDHGTLPDLAFYVIATRASARALEQALAFADEAVTAGRAITEMDAYQVYLDTLHATVAALLPELRVARTLTNFHSGARTIFPAMPVAFPVTAAANTLKIDAGCLLFDPDGVLLGCSDIARTLAFSDEGRELYGRFERGVREVMVPACAAGRTGAEIHAAGVSALWGEGKPVGNPLFVDLADPVGAYDRDVGHLLGKNNLAHLTFTSRSQERLSDGMIACCEYQWPIAGHAIAYEDTCLVTPDGGLNLTSDED